MPFINVSFVSTYRGYDGFWFLLLTKIVIPDINIMNKEQNALFISPNNVACKHMLTSNDAITSYIKLPYMRL